MSHHVNHGFSLIELAVVIAIVALLLGGMLMPLSAQRDIESQKRAEKTLADVAEALLGFAAANGRLPCPASSTSTGLESFCNNPDPGQACVATTVVQTLGRCSTPADGFLPAATLGLSPVDSSGFLLDPWNNRIRYAISFVADAATSGASTRYVFTAQSGMRSRTLSSLAGDPNLRICPDSTCTTALTTQAVLAVWSNGRNASTSAGGAGTDERENPNPNSGTVADPTTNKFVAHLPSGASANEFDDLVTWLSPNTLYNRMITAGQLP